MKRFLIIIAVLAMSVSLFCIPAFASSEEVYTVSVPGSFSVADPLGDWEIIAVLNNGEHYEFPIFTLTELPTDDVGVDVSYPISITSGEGELSITVLPFNDELYSFAVSGSFNDSDLGEVTFKRVVAPPDTGEGSLISVVMGVFTSIGRWVVSSLGNLIDFVWDADAGSLTFIGVLSVCGLAFAVALFVLYIVLRFFHMR